jgi:SsrA-binding protein
MSDLIKVIATNRKARHEFHIEDRYEAGLVLTGTEVKSLRAGKVNMQDAYCVPLNGDMTLINCHISPYKHGTYYNHEPLRNRTLLLHKREIFKLAKAIDQKGYTVVPLKMYFKNGRAKIEIGIAKGKKLYDKRASLSERDNKRLLDRVMKEAKQSYE